MNFQVGDRVVSLFEDFPGLNEGEFGTIVKFDRFGAPIICWDEYNDVRHDADRTVAKGHGWFVDSSMIGVAEPTDLGELPGNSTVSIMDFLFNKWGDERVY